MQVLKLISPLPPSVNHYTSVRTIIKNGKPMAIVYETKEAKDYKRIYEHIRPFDYIRNLITKNNGRMLH